MSKGIPKSTTTVGRNAFISRWMEECGITYDMACLIYRTMVSSFEDGIANGQKVTIGRLGALVPRWQDSRMAVMGFRRVQGGMVRQKQEYFLDPRIRYKFKIHKEWARKSHLNWSQ